MSPLEPGTVVRDTHGREWTVRRSNHISGHWMRQGGDREDGSLVYVLFAVRDEIEYLLRYPASEVESWEVVTVTNPD